ncbi:PREDICTED: uncharacterized protein LOC109588903 [Amphimedon queenslandica]|uniref:Immunoglobulin subtype domain-containing protein n=1 Tax=Amphimedon queenslandica TaxID=400682 RepID=A0AAN0JUJ4_AMPQE|nr:PREDICTED: uncharacterized protein LOC109588903 [Amphimedon queenslandica]|eukprot:XP_019860563.1 PREDICTED: uncharacterized protein LOC109588903 [Amphimedon queenslandica]
MIGVILALIFLRHCAGQTITVQPMSINTTINSTVNFTCEGVGTEITFRLQFYGENETRGATDEVAINRGFSFETSNDNDARTAQLQGTAYEFNNNTSIRCRVDTNNASLSSDVAILMIQGLLDSVVDLDYTFINGSNLMD